MKRVCYSILAFLIASTLLNAQGIVRGKVTDESGESLIGVIVSLKSNRATGVQTDLDGNYSIKIPEGSSQVLVVSYVSFKTIEQPIKALTKNEVFIKNFTLLSQDALEEVVIVAKQVKANEYYMENVKKQSAATIDYISSETMKKTGDANVVSAVARVSGVSSSGGLITVRGIGDRYVKTTLNGSRIPTLDPLTNNIKLDLFPASLVDNIIITKTASPDLPGDWSGAYLSIETKDYPEKLLINLESQFGYNAQTTFKDYISSDRSSTDWLGYDNGLRNRTHVPPQEPNLVPSTYDEMIALGLGSYYSSLGLTKDWGSNDNPAGATYFKLGLVQLGLLEPALINDPVAYDKAKLDYVNQGYKRQAFSKINPEGTDYGNGFANNWNTKMRKAPLNFSQNFSVGNQTTLFKKPLGYLFGIRYGSSIRYDPNGVSKRAGAEQDGYNLLVDDNALISRETNGWSALINLAYKLNDKNSVSLLFMPNFTGTNDVAKFSTAADTSSFAQEGRVSKNQFYEQRKQIIYQLKSEHFISGPKLKIDFNASYTKGNSVAPDFKVVDYDFVRDNSTGEYVNYNFGPNVRDGVRRYYRYLSDNVFDSRISAELPIGKSIDAGVRKLKFGGAYQQNDRKQDLYDYFIYVGNATPPIMISDDLGSVLNADNFIMTNQEVAYTYKPAAQPANFTFGKSTIKSAFALADYSILSFLRIAGGLRVEHATIFSDVVSFHNRGYKAYDIRRANPGFPFSNPANFNELSFLPSANVIFKLKENKFGQLNFRLNYSQTVARPSMRELNDAPVYDNEFRTQIYGNSDLKMAEVKNYDFRFESYFKNGDNISLSVFYKDFTNHIEMSFGSGGLTWNNVGRSTVRGIELEGKKSLTKHFEFRTNVTFVKSNSQVIRYNINLVDGGTKLYLPQDTINRPMFGQAPYIVNGMLVYTADSLGLTATLSYNIQGPRLVIAGIIPGRPDVYEIQRNLLDFKISKTLGKHFSVSITVRDILNEPVKRAYINLNNGYSDRDFDSFRYGTNYLFSFGYRL